MKLSPWVFALIISCSLCFGQVQYGKDFEDMSQTEKMMIYKQFKKSPEAAIALSIIPLGGYIYTERIGRGILFSIPKVLLISTSSFFIFEEYELYIFLSQIATGVSIGIQIFELYDNFKFTKKYNHNLYREIFGKEPPSFSLNLQPTYQGANLNLTYSFK